MLRKSLLSATILALCVVPLAGAQGATTTGGTSPVMMSVPSIQTETTLNLTAEGKVTRAPDIMMISLGVMTEAVTASDAMAANARQMTGLMASLKKAGIAEKDIQTSNLSLSPKYDYPERRAPELVGYQVSNQVTVKVRDLKNAGQAIDAAVSGGGNMVNSIAFGIDDPSKALDEARTSAMSEAMARAELYARAAGYRVKRVVSISEQGGYFPQPQPKMMMARMDMAESYSTPVAGGEMDISVSVSVQFELEK